MSMEKISEAILGKIKSEADEIIREAEEKARERLESARKQQTTRFEEEKARLLAEASSEAARIKAQASISIRLELLKAKNEIIDEIVSKVKTSLAEYGDSTKLAISLIKEGIQAADAQEVDVRVAPADVDKVKDAIKADSELSSKVKSVKEINCIGGAVVLDIKTGLSIDNTLDTRLETLLPRVLPEISSELFGS